MALIPDKDGGVFRKSRAPSAPAPSPSPSPAPSSSPFRTRGEKSRDEAAARAFRGIAERQVTSQERAATAVRADPDRAAEVNNLSKWVGAPPATVDRRLDRYKQERDARALAQAMDEKPALASWFENERRAAVSNDDYGALGKLADVFGLDMTKQSFIKSEQELDALRYAVTTKRQMDRNVRAATADGFLDRLGASVGQGLSSIESGIFTVSGAARAWSADNPLPWTSEENIARDRTAASNMRTLALVTRKAAPVRGGTTWEDVKAAPSITSVGSFIAEQGAASLPGMALAGVNPLIFGGSMTGNIAQDRAQNNGNQVADIGDVLKATPSAAASVMLERLGIKGIFGAAGSTALRRTAGAAGTEAVTEFAQSFIEYAGGTVGTDAGFDVLEGLDQAFAGALAGAGMGGGLRGAGEAAQSLATRFVEVSQARTGEATIAGIMDEAAQSNTRKRDPRLFEQFMDGISQGTPLENLFVPAEKIRELYQSNGWEMGQDDDGHMSGAADDFWKQVDAGLKSGGDVVIPMSRAAAMFAGTPEWDYISGSVRASPGGISPDEATSIEEASADVLTAMGEAVTKQAREEREASAPRERVFTEVLSQARAAGFSLNSARAYADLWADRYETRSERLGDGRDAFALFEQSFAGIRTNGPESVKPYRTGDGLDVLINAIRQRAEPMAPRAKSLVETIVEGGGVIDTGGDLAAMGGDKVVAGGIFGRRRKSLIRETDDTGDMLGGDANADYGLDEWALRLWEAGFFGEVQDRPSVNDLLDLIGQELSGDKVYSLDALQDPAVEANNKLVEAAEDLRQMLESMDVDPDTASREEIEAAIAAFEEQEDPSRSLEQGEGGSAPLPETIEVDGVSRPSVNSKGNPLARTEEGVRNFWRWFGDSKVVDAAGKPLVVYHGTNANAYSSSAFQWFNTSGERGGSFFSSDADIAASYGEQRYDGYLALKEPLVIYADGQGWASLKGDTRAVGDREDPSRRYSRSDQDLLDELSAELSDISPLSEDIEMPASGTLGALGMANTDIDAIAKKARRLGYDGVIVRDVKDGPVSDSLQSVADTFVAFDPAQIKSVDNSGAFDPSDARMLFQSQDQGGARGRIEFLADNRAAITLFEGRDLSTLLHEGGHLWLEELRADALALTAGKVFGDWETVKAWFKREGLEVSDDGEIPTEAHELWARGMERYFMEGKAPSRSLEGAFSSFRAWLLRIYKVVANLRSPIDNDVRGVMDRLVATDNAIAWAVHEADERALFETVVPDGMSPQEAQAYRGLIEQSRTEAFDALLYRTMERVRRSRTAKYREEEERVRAKAAKAIEARPEFAALRLIRGVGSEHMPLNKDGVIERVGRDAIAALPKGPPGSPSITAGGLDPDIVAQEAGYPDGRTMLEALMGVEARRKELVAAGDKRNVQQEAVDLETEAAMRERHADAFDDGSIEEEALELIQTDAGAERLASEVRQLSRALKTEDNPPAPLQVVRSWAERIVREGRIVDQATGAAVARHRRSKAAASKRAEASYLSGDMETAYRAKQREMVAAELWRASRAAKEETDVISRRLDRLARARTLKGMDQEYLERIHELLESHDLRARSQEDVRERESFDRWAKAQEEAGFEVFIPERLTLAGNKHFTRLTYEEIVALDDTVQSLAHLGREKKQLLIAQEERALDELIGEAQMATAGIPLRKFTNNRNEDKSIAREAMGAFLKIEFLADKMDDYKPNGVWNRVLVEGSKEAANVKEALQQKVLDPLAKLYLEMPAKRKRRLSQRTTVPEFITINPETKAAEATTFTHSELLAVALNVGNTSNLEKMVTGETLALPDGVRDRYAWSEDKVMAVLDRELDEGDWQFVEAIWKQIDLMWPDIARSERDISGVAPEKIQGRKVKTRYGEFEGGYYPVVYDPMRSTIAQQNAEDDAGKLLGQMGRSVSTPKGHTITRTGAALPIHFSLERVLFNHVNRVATRVAYGRFIRDALKFSQDPRVRKMVNEHAGPEYFAQIKPWLQRQVSDASMDINMLSGVDRVLRQFRVNATMVGLGLRFTTMLAQFGGWNNSVKEIGAKWMGRGASEMIRNMGSIRGWVFEQSPELAGRSQAFDRDIRTFYRDAGSKLRGKRSGMVHRTLDAAGVVGEKLGVEKLQAAAFWGIAMIDVYAVAMPTWIGAWYKATETMGMSGAEATAFADKAVRKSQSAGRAKDLAAIQDSAEPYRNFTLFYSYFSVQLNQQFEAVQLAKKGEWAKVANNVFWIMLLAPMAGSLLTGDWPDEGDDGERDVGDWASWAASRVFFGLWSGLPGIRDVASSIQRKSEGKFTGGIEAPFYRAFSEIQRPIEEGIKVGSGEGPSDRWLRNTITPIGYFTGLPTGQIGNTSQYLLDYTEGEQNPENVGEALYGVAKGPQKEQE